MRVSCGISGEGRSVPVPRQTLDNFPPVSLHDRAIILEIRLARERGEIYYFRTGARISLASNQSCRVVMVDKYQVSSQEAPWANKIVLVVDDYQSIRNNMRELTRSLGMNCLEAENGLQALETIKSTRPDVIISDLVMPEMDGFELTEAIKSSATLRNIPVVIISTHADSKYIFKALRLGADDYLTKPASKGTLSVVLNRIFDHEW